MQERKKILFLITKGNFGGAQRYVYDLATHLPKEQFEAVVACGTKEGTTLIQKLSEKNIRTIGLEASEREINLKNDLTTVKEIIKLIKTEQPHILHLNSSKIGLLGALAVLFLKLRAPSFKLKAIFTSHGWAFNEQHRSALSKIIFYIAHYFTVVVCDKTIAVSEKTKRDIAWLPFIKNKIKVIHNGIEKFKTLTKKDCAEILKKEDKDQKIILTIAELHPNKGIDVALRGLALLPEK
jgi:glycosyltransferase involved in cell wall biosynthesis